jgi:hypothetical protein
MGGDGRQAATVAQVGHLPEDHSRRCGQVDMIIFGRLNDEALQKLCGLDEQCFLVIKQAAELHHERHRREPRLFTMNKKNERRWVLNRVLPFIVQTMRIFRY